MGKPTIVTELACTFLSKIEASVRTLLRARVVTLAFALVSALADETRSRRHSFRKLHQSVTSLLTLSSDHLRPGCSIEK